MGWLAAKLVPHGVDFSFCVYVAILFTGLARLALLAQVNTHTILTCDWLPDRILTSDWLPDTKLSTGLYLVIRLNTDL